ncbi:GNAT family acetyltransferase [Penicillium angulare]|uniref:GNAT family acetyltransferase n=1 Tax=Penicillium angulare TaxID=116970 RepID=UPI00253FFD6D|nr:GNAT family acetyltransferase [Penicillium angulare]KAJ5290965.1 GNAT family acetyltransferase [Penicillium angulare]
METPRLNLVRLTPKHLSGYHEIWSDPIATRWSSHGPCKDYAATEEWMSGLLPEKNPLGENYAVFLREGINGANLGHKDDNGSGAAAEHLPNLTKKKHLNQSFFEPGFLLGVVGTWNSDPVPEVAIIFHQLAWGYGFATEALNAFVEIFWKERPMFSVLEAYCDTENKASAGVLKKCGFELVETVVGDYVLPWMERPLRNSLRFRITREQ